MFNGDLLQVCRWFHSSSQRGPPDVCRDVWGHPSNIYPPHNWPDTCVNVIHFYDLLGLYKIWQCLKSSLICKHIQQNKIAIPKPGDTVWQNKPRRSSFMHMHSGVKAKSHEIQLKFDHSQWSVPLFVCSDRRWQWQLRVLACAEMLLCDCGIETHVVVQRQQQFSAGFSGSTAQAS